MLEALAEIERDLDTQLTSEQRRLAMGALWAAATAARRYRDADESLNTVRAALAVGRSA